MDMPISIPRMSIAQGVDDLKTRDMILCRFPEVAMVVGKLGRADTPTDPAPLDMIETMIEFHRREFWPARAITAADARRQVEAVAAALVSSELIDPFDRQVLDPITETTIGLFDAQMREYAYQRNRELFRSAGFDEASWRLDGLSTDALRRWREHVRTLDAELLERGAGLVHAAGDRRNLVARSHQEIRHLGVRRRAETTSLDGRGLGASPLIGASVAPCDVAHGRDAGEPGAPAGARCPARRTDRRGSPAAWFSGGSAATRWSASAATSIVPCRCPAGRTSGRCRFRTGWTCWPRA